MPTLGEILKRARHEHGLSLRDVERNTDNKISNGHLSLLESDEVKSPSPNHLYRLAQVYALPYADLMRLAGYYMPPVSDSAQTIHGQQRAQVSEAFSGIALSSSDLTPDEIRDVERYVEWVRSKRPHTTESQDRAVAHDASNIPAGTRRMPPTR